jgi:hypothetical protein
MLEAIIPQVYCVLDKYSKKYSRSGIVKNLNKWERNKGWLVDLLRRHSNWNEEALAVIFEVTQSREINSSLVNTYKGDLFNIFRELDKTAEEGNNFYLSLDLTTRAYSKILYNDNVITNIKHYSGVPCAVGQKTSRVINKICQRYGLDKHPEYNSRFARLADSLNPIRIKRKALLSVHPCDYLEMSNSRNSWTSCHCLEDGAYHGGTLSYMNDGCSMIFYTVDDDIEEEDYFEASKRSRQVFCFENGILLQSRLYPNTDDTEAVNTYRNIVQLAIADCFGLPNLWALKRDEKDVAGRVQTHEDSLNYPDYNYSCYHANVSLLKDSDVGADEYVLIGNTAYCLECSRVITENDSLYCDDCTDHYYTCQQCGARIREDDVNFINDGYYCDECCSYCDDCQQYIVDDLTEVHCRRGHLISVCDSCRENYYYCEDCDEYYHPDNGISLDDGFHCDDCLGKHYRKCESCGEYIYSTEAIEFDGGYYCASCAEDLTVELEENQTKVLVCVGGGIANDL